MHEWKWTLIVLLGISQELSDSNRFVSQGGEKNNLFFCAVTNNGYMLHFPFKNHIKYFKYCGAASF